MQLLLLCGALLGVASQVLIKEQHTSIQAGAVAFSWRGTLASFDAEKATISLIKVDSTSTKSHACNSPSFMGGKISTPWYTLRAINKDQPKSIKRNNDDDGVLFKTGPINCANSNEYKNTCGHGTTGGQTAATTGLEPGKYRMCGCFSGTCNKQVDALVQSDKTKIQYSTDLGYLHVVESTPILGTLSNSLVVGSPRLFLQSDINATASWLFSNTKKDSKAASDQFMVCKHL